MVSDEKSIVDHVLIRYLKHSNYKVNFSLGITAKRYSAYSYHARNCGRIKSGECQRSLKRTLEEDASRPHEQPFSRLEQPTAMGLKNY